MKPFLIIFLLLTLFSRTGFSADITPGLYFELEIKSSRLNLESMEKQLSCFQRGCPDSERYAISDEYEQKTVALHKARQTSASRLSGWYTRNADMVDTYLLTNPNLQIQLEELAASFEVLSDAIKPFLEAQE